MIAASAFFHYMAFLRILAKTQTTALHQNIFCAKKVLIYVPFQMRSCQRTLSHANFVRTEAMGAEVTASMKWVQISAVEPIKT